MGNRVPFSTLYFCGNCEEEVVGIAPGYRVPSRRPLCSRCTEIGVGEGWGVSNIAPKAERISRPEGKRGIITILVMMVVVGFVLFMAKALFDRK